MSGAKKILVIHGPNLNLLGKREPEIYGRHSLAEIDAALSKRGKALGFGVTSFQSNWEGALVEHIQQAYEKGGYAGVIINPAAYTHTSVAIRDALLLLDLPIVEVHLSNIAKREDFRHKSLIADIAIAQISGFGARGYLLALEGLAAALHHGKDGKLG